KIITPGEEAQFRTKGMELLTVYPLNVITVHGVLLGLIVCLALFPIFGRPRQMKQPSHSDFAEHLNSVANLMVNSRDTAYARGRISEYMRRMRGETNSPWLLPPEASRTGDQVDSIDAGFAAGASTIPMRLGRRTVTPHPVPPSATATSANQPGDKTLPGSPALSSVPVAELVQDTQASEDADVKSDSSIVTSASDPTSETRDNDTPDPGVSDDDTSGKPKPPSIDPGAGP
ncbi:MAG: hypothetical protein AAFP90_20395, partial [Planctomycetota bacterium]